MTLHKRKIHVFFAIAFILCVIVILFPTANEWLITIRTHAYVYGYTIPRNLLVEDTSKMPPADAVPILMYHGVVVRKNDLGANTKRKDFIAQMEMLKRNGFQTISVKEYDLFRQGEFVLPARPIIITFDDGRKDSFFTTDDILKKLGFKATIFVATGRTNTEDPFFLSWTDLEYMRDSGRWEIEAHGRDSHDKFVNNEKGDIGVYLTSRMYTVEKGLESIPDYESRVRADYQNTLKDLKDNLGIDAKYFAVPLNSYGDDDHSNYSGASEFNKRLISEYFTLAFVQAADKNNEALESFYNYKDTNKIDITRLDVKGMSADQLLFVLRRFEPTQPLLEFSGRVPQEVSKNFELLYGKLDTEKGIELSSNATTPSARILFGDKRWEDYTVSATVLRQAGQDTSLLAYYVNEKNFIELTWGQDIVTLIEYKEGKKRTLALYYPWKKQGAMHILLYVHNDTVSAYVNGEVITPGAKTVLSRGAVGFSVWGPVGAQSILTTLEVKPLYLF